MHRKYLVLKSVPVFLHSTHTPCHSSYVCLPFWCFSDVYQMVIQLVQNTSSPWSLYHIFRSLNSLSMSKLAKHFMELLDGCRISFDLYCNKVTIFPAYLWMLELHIQYRRVWTRRLLEFLGGSLWSPLSCRIVNWMFHHCSNHVCYLVVHVLLCFLPSHPLTWSDVRDVYYFHSVTYNILPKCIDY